MTGKHTQAPWAINTSSGYTDIVATENATQKIAMLNGQTMELEELEANAQLIASAPELLEALEEVFADWLTLTEQDANDGNQDVLNITEKARKARAKAKGELKDD